MSAAVPVGAEFLVNTTTTAVQTDPAAAALPGGGFVVAWSDASQTGGDTSLQAVRAQVFDATGAPVGGEILVNTTTTGSQAIPTVAGLPGGGFVVAWTDGSGTGGDTSGFAVRAQVFDATGAKLGDEIEVNTSTWDWQYEPTVAALPGGGFVVAWRDESRTGGDTSGSAIRAQVFDATGAKLGGEILVNTTTLSDQWQPTVTGLPGGGFVVAWRDQSASGGDTSGAAVRAQLFDATGAKLGGEILVNTTTANSQGQPTIAALPGGGFVVAWMDFSATGGDTSGAAVRAQLFDATGAKVGDEFLVNTTTAGNQYDPTVTALPGGGFVVAWADGSATGGDTSGLAVRAQVFDATGAKVGGEFLVNTTTTGDQYEPAVAGLAGFGFLAAWRDMSATGGDTSGAAIRAQLFATALPVQGTAGDDSLRGGPAGGDTLEGLGGNDTLAGLAGGDSLDGGAGTDTADYSASDAGVSVDLGAGTATGGHAEGDSLASIENLTGSAHADTLTGDGGANLLQGGGGDDVLSGGGGRDRLIGGAGGDSLDGGAQADVLDGGAGDDTLMGGAGNDRLQGRAGADLLAGDVGNDRLDGGAGDDTLIGGEGRDLLTGGAGADVFDFALAAFEGNDRILDWEDGTDRIRVAGGDFADIALASAQAGASTRVTLASGTTILIEGAAFGTIGAEDFVFV